MPESLQRTLTFSLGKWLQLLARTKRSEFSTCQLPTALSRHSLATPARSSASNGLQCKMASYAAVPTTCKPGLFSCRRDNLLVRFILPRLKGKSWFGITPKRCAQWHLLDTRSRFEVSAGTTRSPTSCSQAAGILPSRFGTLEAGNAWKHWMIMFQMFTGWLVVLQSLLSMPRHPEIQPSDSTTFHRWLRICSWIWSSGKTGLKSWLSEVRIEIFLLTQFPELCKQVWLFQQQNMNSKVSQVLINKFRIGRY